IKFLPNRLAVSRFAFVISSKFAKTAVERNLIRRRAYETIGLVLKSALPNLKKTCYDVVVLCRTAAPILTYKLIKKDLESMLSKLL
ncbi:MAG: ribonuclease P protein component, partial [Candidatus Gracilibacteria bacterium]